MSHNEKVEPKPVRSEMTQKQELELTRPPLPQEFIRQLQHNTKTLEERLKQSKERSK